MTPLIPDTHKDLVEGPVYVTLTTILPDGQPHSSVIWWDGDDQHILINTARGRQKDKDMIRNPKVTIMAIDPTDPYRWMEVRGVVEEMTEEGAVDHIEKLSWKYKNQKYYGGFTPAERREQETRVIAKVRPTKVVARGVKK